MRIAPPVVVVRGERTLHRVASKWTNTGAKRGREARADLGLGSDGPLDDLLTVVEDAGAHVVVLDLPDGVAGAYIAKPDCPLLFVNGAQWIARQRFTLAHEFGHHRMEHDSVVDQQVAISGYLHDPNEVCANAFAAEFLMPRRAIARWGADNVRGDQPTLEHVCVLAAQYGVSAQAARYALEAADVLTSARRKRQLDQEIAEELHVDLFRQQGLEPLEDELAAASARRPRIPRALRDTALGDLLAGTVDVDGFAARVNAQPNEVEAMLAALGLDQLLATA
jgi:Zn-dependent peptidase ImmA (M78 family)